MVHHRQLKNSVALWILLVGCSGGVGSRQAARTLEWAHVRVVVHKGEGPGGVYGDGPCGVDSFQSLQNAAAAALVAQAEAPAIAPPAAAPGLHVALQAALVAASEAHVAGHRLAHDDAGSLSHRDEREERVRVGETLPELNPS